MDVLDPFFEATQLTEGERTVTISFALPSVLSLIKQLQDMIDKQQLKFCSSLCNGLLKSLRTRFSGMLTRMQMNAQPDVDVNSMPYGSDIYIIAAHFDTRFKFQWVESYVDPNQEQVQALVAKLNNIVRALFVESTNAFRKRITSAQDAVASTSSASDVACEPPPAKKFKLFATSTTARSNRATHSSISLSAQMNKYISTEC